VITAITIYKNGLAPLKLVRDGINAFTLTEKEIGEANLPLKEEIIAKALLLINKAMSTDLLTQWIKKYKHEMECE